MTMYLPNRDVHPTGFEAAEFIEPSAFAPAPDRSKPAEDGEDDDEDDGQMDARTS